MSAALAMQQVRRITDAGLGAPLLLLLTLAMMVLPLPPFVLDVLFTFNIALALIVLMAGIYSRRPLDFGSFPTVLLVATLMRLALNVASTRVVLLEGHNGGGAAGKVIEAFGEFVIGGNYAVGLVVFAILVIINFVVVTKGASRISEVSARFTLDALPGKQMSIDADVNAGLITQEQARARRAEVAEEADFYGAMDGAGKFVRGDAVAGILILLINLVGGVAIGVMQHALSFSEATRSYALLTIGDGLVAQIPSLLLSTAAGIMVTRVSSAQELGHQVLSQLFANPRSLAVTAVMIGAMGLVPGMPNLAFLALAALAGFGAWAIARRAARVQVEEEPAEVAPPAPSPEVSWEDVSSVDPLGLEVGYRLIPLVDTGQGGTLLARIKGVRKKASQDLGFLIPAVHVRDNLDLAPSAYRISVMGVVAAEGEVRPDRELAINPGEVFGKVPGDPANDPVFGLEAVWIARQERDQAQALGYTVVDPNTVIATHLSQVMASHAHLLLGHEEVQQLVDRLKERHPKLVEDLIPKTISLGALVKILRNLLEERIAVRDMRTIAESLAQLAGKSQDPDVLTGGVRVALGRFMAQELFGSAQELPVIALDPALDQILQRSAQSSEAALEPGLAERLGKSLAEAAKAREAAGQPAVVVVSDAVRALVARIARHAAPTLNVLAFSELPEHRSVRIVASVGREASPKRR